MTDYERIIRLVELSGDSMYAAQRFLRLYDAMLIMEEEEQAAIMGSALDDAEGDQNAQ